LEDNTSGVECDGNYKNREVLSIVLIL